MVGNLFRRPDALPTGFGENGGNSGLGGGGDGRSGRFTGDQVVNPKDLRHLKRGCVDLLVAGAEEDGEREECLNQIAAMQIDVIIGL